MWAVPMVKLPCSKRGNYKMYIVSVTPYMPGADGAKKKNSLVGACELFCNQQILTNYAWNVYNGKYWRTIIILHSHDYSMTVKKNSW